MADQNLEPARSIDLGQAVEAISGGILRAVEARGVADLKVDSPVWQRIGKIEGIAGGRIILEVAEKTIIQR